MKTWDKKKGFILKCLQKQWENVVEMTIFSSKRKHKHTLILLKKVRQNNGTQSKSKMQQEIVEEPLFWTILINTSCLYISRVLELKCCHYQSHVIRNRPYVYGIKPKFWGLVVFYGVVNLVVTTSDFLKLRSLEYRIQTYFEMYFLALVCVCCAVMCRNLLSSFSL